MFTKHAVQAVTQTDGECEVVGATTAQLALYVPTHTVLHAQCSDA